MTQNSTKIAGLGDEDALLKVYIANRPAFDFHGSVDGFCAVKKGDIYACGQACGNGWRKVFNVYAKLVYAAALPIFGSTEYACWQDYRDKKLLQSGARTSLMFAAPTLKAQTFDIHVVMGRTYAKTLSFANDLQWLDDEFAINQKLRVIVCPYFDYRQLSNIKIVRLVELIRSLSNQ